MTELVNEIAAFDGRIAKISGPVRSGKTEALIRRAAACIAEGCAPGDILIETSTAEAARLARRRLAAALHAVGVADADTAAEAVVIATAQQICLAVLETPEARAATGRNPRVLAPFEYNFFLEDMKTLGTPIRRLRSVLNHFKAQWCALAPEDEWVTPGEERETLDHARRLLTATGAMLADEVAYLCGTYLQSDAGAAARQQFAHVLADDFQNLSLAQQTCLCLLARDQVIVAGNSDETVACATDFPAPEGFDTFDTLRRGVTTFTLETAFGNPNITDFCDRVAATGNQDALTAATREGVIRDIATVKWNTPDDEFNGVTRYLFATNAENPEALQSDICLVAPTKQWAHAFSQMLAKRGFATSVLGFERLAGDPRDLNRAKALVAYTSLNLLADPEDLFAWRAWLGFGNYLTYSDGWNFLLNWCDEHEKGIFDALEAASAARSAGDAEPFPRGERLAERYDAGRKLIAVHSARRGHALLAAVGAEGLRDFAALSVRIVGDEDAATLYALVRETQFNPVHEDDPRAVRVSSYEQMCGCGYRAVYAVGCVDGYVPARDAFEVVSTDADRAQVLEDSRRTFVAGVSKASDTLMFSTFSKAPLELAERTKMQVSRVRMEAGERVATLRPTCFLEQAGGAAPITLGGQALLADMGID